MAPSTFASAAASGANSPKPDSTSEWSRRTNGLTPFRRSSAAVTSSASSSAQPRDPPAPSRNSSEAVGVYIPPHRNGTTSDLRYSREQLLDLYRSQKQSGQLDQSMAGLYVNGWEPESNGISSSPWARREDQKDTSSGADICWDHQGRVEPLTLKEFSIEEKELFSGSVNSPIKPPTQTAAKDATPRDTMNRKTSISASQNSPASYNLTSPTARPGTRRRDTSEAFPFPAPQSSSGMGRFTREEGHGVQNPPPSLVRRRTDFKDTDQDDSDKDKFGKTEPPNPFGLKRSVTGGFGSNGSWGASPNSTFSPIGGAFGNFSLPGATSASTEKRPGYASLRGESRFKNLMKDSTEDQGKGLSEQSSLANLGKSIDLEEPRGLKLFAEESAAAGSAALQGGDDASPPKSRSGPGLFGGAGRPSQDPLGLFPDPAATPQKRQDLDHVEPMSPTDTNPYQSPENDRPEPMQRNNGKATALPGLGGFAEEQNSLAGLAGFGLRTNLMDPERSTLGSPASRGLGNASALPGLGSSSAWPSMQSVAPSATPTRERGQAPFGSAFGDGIFSPVDQNASLPFGSGNPFGSASGFGSMRGNRLQSLLPQSMQEPSHPEANGMGEDHGFDSFQQSPFAGLGRTPFGAPIGGPPRDTESPFRAARGPFDDLGSMSTMSGNQAGSPIISSEGTPQNQSILAAGAPGAQRSAAGPQRQSSVNSTSSSQPPAPQVRQMVMPDRMKWVYKDPNGQTQGPWSGLEMHDWYKAGFFTPELLIKKLEDSEFEPLAHLIRRIGNSREPFLVPQIGIPHEPPPNARGWNSGGIQPPFPNSFPTFGTTLTAEQQNALERRKQEEQFLMARQKEQLMQRQFLMTQGGPFPPQLQHQASAQSLHSQPSFGNMVTGAGFASSSAQPIGPPSQSMSNILDASYGPSRQGGMSSMGQNLDMFGPIRDEDLPGLMEQLGPRNAGPLGGSGLVEGSVGMMLQDRARLQREQAEANQQMHGDEEAEFAAGRLRQFQDLRAEDMMDEPQPSIEDRMPPINTAHESIQESQRPVTQDEADSKQVEKSITQQVQATVAKKGSQPVSWIPVDSTTMQPIPPPQSSSPMPAPVAQRKQNVADTLHAGSRSRSQTPSVETPSASIAPWAKETSEVPKGPSLKEIQKAEAKKAQQQEEIAAAARRAAMEKELLTQQTMPQPQPGLPSSSNWASGPGTVAAPSPWAKPSNGKVAVASNGKKTLQQIQKEEEARKQRQAAAAAANVTSPTAGGPPGLVGKRYADLASKVGAAPPTAPGGGAWTTVGAGGKIKTPVNAPAPTVARTVSGTVAPAPAAAPAKPKAPARSTTTGSNRLGQMDAMGEFKKWAVKELTSHVQKGIDPVAFVESLFELGLDDVDIITEAVHASTSTIDSRHFAHEFINRRKLAQKGVVAPDSSPAAAASSASGSNSGGWSEVAKKGPQPQDGPNNFKVVAAKKKGGRR